MIVKVLSNHPQAKLRQVQQGRAAKWAGDLQRHEQEVVAHEEQVGALTDERDQARADRRWGRWVQQSFGVHRARKRVPPRPAPPPVDERLEGSLQAGIEGEQRIEDELAAAFNDDWTLYRGYCNARGEIDQLLLGPHGVAAIEIKNQRVTVSCDGDDWWFERYSNGDYLQEEGPFVDKQGRSPSVQLNESTAALERFLASRDLNFSFWRIVVLTHPRAHIKSATNPTVNLIDYSVATLIDWMRAKHHDIAPEFLEKVDRLIERDHAFHARRRG
jgi:hypothetical protein